MLVSKVTLAVAAVQTEKVEPEGKDATASMRSKETKLNSSQYDVDGCHHWDFLETMRLKNNRDCRIYCLFFLFYILRSAE